MGKFSVAILQSTKKHQMEVKKEEFEPDEKVKKHATTYVETIIHFVKAGCALAVNFQKSSFNK